MTTLCINRRIIWFHTYLTNPETRPKRVLKGNDLARVLAFAYFSAGNDRHLLSDIQSPTPALRLYSMKKDSCRLNFEGEDEKDKETDVDRRYVLDVGNK